MQIENKKVLVVDDEEKNIELAKVILRKEGYALFFAENGYDALALMRSHRIDILVLDLMLPDISGFDVLQRLRQLEGTAVPQTVVVSALSDEETREAAQTLGAQRYLSKPYDIMMLKSILREMTAAVAMSDEEVEYRLQVAYAEITAAEDDEAMKKVIQTYLSLEETVPVSMQTQLDYLAWFFNAENAELVIGEARFSQRAFRLGQSLLLDRLQSRMNRILIARKVHDASALSIASKRFFLPEP